MIMYKDMYLKLKFHKEVVIKNLLKKGIYPSNELISQEVSELDKRMALFKAYVYQPGTKLNVKELNHNIEMIYKDLNILYEVLYDLAINEYSKLYNFVETHLNSLESTVDKYVKRAIEETNSTTLGKTLFFQSNSFDIENNDDKVTINLGTLSLFAGDRIACFANINNVESSDIKFSFANTDDVNDFSALAYNHNNDVGVVPGEPSIVKHEVKSGDNFKDTGELKLDNMIIDKKSIYDIYAGKSKILVKDIETGRNTYYDFPTVNNPLQLDKASYISFYLLDCENAEFTFNMKPIHTNFSLADTNVEISEDSKKFYIEAQKDFTFYFNIDKGDAFAAKEQGIIKNNSLYYYGTKISGDMQVREYKKDKPINYDVKTIIQSEYINDLKIDSIYIKEL